MCCKDEQECCDEKYNFKLYMNGSQFPTTEEAGKEFAEWLNTGVGWKFYKGMVENLKFAAVGYKEYS